MTALSFVLALAVLALAGFLVWLHQRQTQALLDAERARTNDWWTRSQRHIDNLQDRVMAKEWEVYAQAAHVPTPGDQPTMTAEGEFGAGRIAEDMLEILRGQQAVDTYAGDIPDVAEDYAGPIVG